MSKANRLIMDAKIIKHNCNLMIKTDFIKAGTEGFGFFQINCQLLIVNYQLISYICTNF